MLRRTLARYSSITMRSNHPHRRISLALVTVLVYLATSALAESARPDPLEESMRHRAE